MTEVGITRAVLVAGGVTHEMAKLDPANFRFWHDVPVAPRPGPIEPFTLEGEFTLMVGDRFWLALARATMSKRQYRRYRGKLKAERRAARR